MLTLKPSIELLVRISGRLPVPSTVSRTTHCVVLLNGVGTVAPVPVLVKLAIAVHVPSKVAGEAVQKKLTRNPDTFDGTAFAGKPSSTRRSFVVNGVAGGTTPGTVCAFAAPDPETAINMAQASDATDRTPRRRAGREPAFRGEAIMATPILVASRTT